MTDALNEVRVIDLATVVAGPGTARHLADFSADVIKVESPAGDPARGLGWTGPDEDDSYFWKMLGRGKRCVRLDLKSAGDLARMRRLLNTSDVLIENMRPGKLEALGLDPKQLLRDNPRLVVLRVSGFGQNGPYSSKPGFATLAEAMSGLAALSGEPGGQPLLPPIALTDEVTAIVGAFAVMLALRHAERSGEGQVVDVSLLESMFQLMGPLPAAYAHLDYLQPRLGAGIPYTVPRGTYRCADDVWVAISSSAETVAQRVLTLIGADGDPRFATFQDRFHNREALERRVAEWVAARTSTEVFAAFDRVDAAIAPVYTMADIATDPHFAAREALIDVEGVRMQNVIAKLARTPGRVRHAGRPPDADGPDIRAELDEAGLEQA